MSRMIVLGKVLALNSRRQAEEREWVVLKEWSGESGNTETETFTTTSPLFRISWEIAEEGRDGLLDVYVRDARGRLVRLAANLSVRIAGYGREARVGTFLVCTEAGVHYLEIRSTDVKWRVAVEQTR